MAIGSSNIIEGKIELGSADYAYKYSDGFFYGSAFQYSHGLAKQSLAMAIASFNRTFDCEYYWGESNNLKQFFKTCDFYDFLPNEDFNERPENNSFGVGIARKKILIDTTRYTILGIGLRGGRYTSEWSGNFNIGTSGNHQGFEIAANKVFDHIKRYVERFGISGNVILWAAGYSRAAAVTNLVGGRIDQYLSRGEQPFEGITLEPYKCFFYTFEAPQGASIENVKVQPFTNIFNIINKNDVVTYSAPTAMGFARYGIDLHLPVKGSVNKEEYEKIAKDVHKRFDKISKKELRKHIPNFMAESLITSPKKKLLEPMSVSAFLEKYFFDISIFVGKREGSQEIFEAIQKAINLLVYPTENKIPNLERVFKKTIEMSINDFVEYIINEDIDDAIKDLRKNFIESLYKEGVTAGKIEEAKQYVDKIFKFFTDFSKEYPEDFNIMRLNIISVIATHDSALTYAYLESLPDNYFKI